MNMESENLESKSASTNFKVTTIITIIIIVTAIVLGGLYYYRSQITPTKVITADYMRSLMNNDSTLSFNEINESKVLYKEELPKDLQILVPANADNVQIQQYTNQSGKVEYKIKFDISQNMHDYFREIRKNLTGNSWYILSSKRSDFVNIIEFENNLYELRMEMVFITEEAVTEENVEKISAETQKSQIVILIKNK